MTDLSEGDEFTVERSFSAADVRAFAALSGDDQARHTERDADDRLLVHGLLTATLPTRVGSELGVLARSMTFEFRRPVYAGEHVRCEVVLSTVREREDGRLDVVGDVCCTRDEDGVVVLTGTFDGLVE